jgi:hypothetical protein
MIWLFTHHLPPLPTTHKKTEKERQLADGRRGRARSRIIGLYEKALSSKNRFILSEVEDCMEWGGVMYCLVLDRDMQAGSAIPHIQT